MKRTIAALFAATMLASTLAGCGGSNGATGNENPPANNENSGQAAGQETEVTGDLNGEIRFSWWGNEARNEATIEAIEFYEAQHPGTAIVPEYSSVDGYYNKLMTQIAGNNAPDIFTTTPEQLPAIVQVNGATDLTGLIDVSTHNDQVVSACSIGGTLYGVNASLNANVVYYNQTQAEELGITMPSGSYTWEDLMAICAEVYEKSGGETYGMVDLRMVNGLETWIPAFNMTYGDREAPFPWTDTEMIINGEDITQFMEFFHNQPEGALTPPEITATIISQVEVPIASRDTFLAFDYSGTFGMYQAQTDDNLEMIEWPDNGNGNGTAVSARPGLIEAVFEQSANKALAIDFLDFFVNDPEAAKILKTVRGVLPSETQREALLASPELLSADDQKVFAIVDQVYGKAVNPYSPGPAGTGDLFGESHMKVIGQKVAFGELTPEEAGAEFERAAQEVLANASGE